MKSKNKAIIVANGSFPRHPLALELLKHASYLICCDGGANDLIAFGLEPDVIVGDGDSISAENKARYQDRMHIITEQETNDLTKSVNYAVEQGYTDLTILGATGRREDHTLGNISLLLDYQHLVDVRMITDYGVFYPCKDLFEMELDLNSQVSIFNFGAKHLATDDLEYPIRDFTSWWQGTLNSTIHPKVKITGEGLFLVYVAFKDSTKD